MKTNHMLALLAVIGGVSAAFTSFSVKNELYPTWKYDSERIQGEKMRYISAPHLADLLYEKEAELVLLDLRSEEEFQTYHIPSAQPFKREKTEENQQKLSHVVYGSGLEVEGLVIPEEWAGKVYVLKGGLEAWKSLVLFPDFAQHKVRNREALEHILRRSRYFGGSPLNNQLLHIDQRQSNYREGC